MIKSKMLFQAGALAALVTCTSVRAFAQGEATTPPPAATATSSSGGGAGLGVGAELWLTGLAGAVVAYDQYVWHIQGVLGIDSVGNGPNPRSTQLIIGASGWYHLARGSNADFSVGGGIGFADRSGGGTSNQAIVLEPGALIRLFLSPNVALSARVGLALTFGDDNTSAGPASRVTLGGQTIGALGVTYFFR